MSTLYERIHSLCLGRDISVGRMCSDTGISRGNLTDLKMGRVKTLGGEALNKIANYFGVSVDFLLTGNEFGIRMVEQWPPDVQLRWQMADTDDMRREILRKHGVTPQYLAQLPVLFGAARSAAAPAGGVGLDEFTYALWQETCQLTDEQKQALLGMARFFKEELAKDAAGEKEQRED